MIPRFKQQALMQTVEQKIMITNKAQNLKASNTEAVVFKQNKP